MVIDGELMRQLLETFRIQLEERLQVLSEGLLGLERGLPDPEREALLTVMFRAAHNIKGASRGVGLEQTSILSHALEDLFAKLRRQELALSPELTDLCLTTIDRLRGLVDLEATGLAPLEELAELRERLNEALEGRLRPAVTPLAQTLVTAESDSIRLPVERLDRVAALSDELQVTKIRIDEHQQAGKRLNELSRQLRSFWNHLLRRAGSGLSSSALLDRHLLTEGSDLILELEQFSETLFTGLRATATQLRPLAASLRDDAHALRMTPAETLLRPLQRSVRDLARAEGKQVEFHIVGGEIEVDRVVLNLLRDPLIHLLRNAVDHGIESSAQRLAAGKPELGHIHVRLRREGGSVVLRVEDDGRGIDVQAVGRKALQQGLLSVEELESLSSAEVVDLIFRPGFSTRDEVNELSGRGIGLDVVRSNLQAVNGRVTVMPVSGGGSRFVLTLPLTMAGDHGLLVRCAGQVFAIPSQYVIRILQVEPNQVVDLEGGQVLVLESEPVPLRNLAAMLGVHEGPAEYRQFLDVVVINRGWHRMALLVDHVLGDRELVIKPLSPPLGQVPNVVGGSLGHDGGVVLVLSVADLFASSAGVGSVVAQLPERARRQVPRILVVDDSITTRTLEVSILEGHGYRVQSAADGSTALERLRHEQFDLVITDVEMPGLDGFELTRRIRQELGLVDLPVVIVTSLDSEKDRLRGVEVKADAYIVKSDFETRELLDVVEQLT